MKKQFFLLAMLFCGQLTMFSQYAVRGTVKDEKGNALIGANVVVGGTTYGVTTNLKGEFLLKSLQPGDYTIHFSYIGFEPLEKAITVSADMSIDAVLTAKAYLADEVIISAIRAGDHMPVTKSTIKKEDIAAGNLGQDIPYLMALAPSVVTSSDAGTGIGYTNFRIRGTDLNRINITVNGIPLNDAESHGVFWVNMPDFASSVENIQIQRGVGTSTQGGGAFGATINLQTLSINKKPYAEIANSAGSFNSFKHSVSFGTGLINDHFTFDGRLSKITSDGFIDRAWSKLKSFYVSGAYYTDKTLVKLNVFSGNEATYQAWDGIPSDILKTNRRYNGIGAYYDDNNQLKYYNNETDNYQQDHFQLHISHAFSNALNLNLSAHYTIGKGYYEQYKDDDQLSKYQLNPVIIGSDTITSSDIIRRKWLDNDFYGITWSLNYTYRNISAVLGGGWNQYYGEHYGRVRWAKYMSNGEMDHEYYYSDGTKNDFNVFAKATYKISDKFAAFGDLQLRKINQSFKGVDDKLQYNGNLRDISQKHDFAFFNPKAGLTFNISERQNAFAYVGVAHREPNRDNFVDADPTKPAPKPEQLIDYELGYNLNYTAMQLGLNLYYMNYSDQLVLTGMINDVGGAVMSNVSKSYRTGIEVTAGVKINEMLYWNGNITFSRNKVKDFTEYVDNWDTWGQESTYFKERSLAFSPEIVAGSQLTMKYKPVEIAWIAKYVDKQYIDNSQSNQRKLDAYFVNDIRINARLLVKSFATLEGIVSINNIFNAQYEANAWVYQYIEAGEHKVMDGYFPQAGRNFMVGLVLKF
jgi:iron complex outermembrane recepter protein